MACVLPADHDPDAKVRRLHEGRNRNGHVRRWWVMLCTCPADATDEEIWEVEGHWPDCPRRWDLP